MSQLPSMKPYNMPVPGDQMTTHLAAIIEKMPCKLVYEMLFSEYSGQ